MIDILQIALRQLFVSTYEQSLDPDAPLSAKSLTVRFAPPNDNFPAQGDQSPFLNVFLVDVRENRKIRRNDKIPIGRPSSEQTTWAPAKLDCHFLATAFVPDDNAPEQSVLNENRLLYEAAAALLRHSPLALRAIFRLPDDFPEPEDLEDENWNGITLLGRDAVLDLNRLKSDPTLLARDLHILPVETMPPEGYPKLSEFWGLMGSKARWRPSVYFVVTLPVERKRRNLGPLVESITTRIINQNAKTERKEDGTLVATRLETTFSVGGFVLQNSPDGGAILAKTPVRNASVTLRATATRQKPQEPAIGLPPTEPLDSSAKMERTTVTDENGRFGFELTSNDLDPGYENWTWKLVVRGQVFPLMTPLVSNYPIEINLTP